MHACVCTRLARAGICLRFSLEGLWRLLWSCPLLRLQMLGLIERVWHECHMEAASGSLSTSPSCAPSAPISTVNTKMLSAGWGSIGMNVDQADNTFHLATQLELLRRSGRYYVGLCERRPPAVAEDPEVQDRLWALWEEQVGAAW